MVEDGQYRGWRSFAEKVAVVVVSAALVGLGAAAFSLVWNQLGDEHHFAVLDAALADLRKQCEATAPVVQQCREVQLEMKRRLDYIEADQGRLCQRLRGCDDLWEGRRHER